MPVQKARSQTAPGVFSRRVYATVRRIPIGRVATYGDVAAAAGKPRAARAVGNLMRDCPYPDVPCHRVIAAGGALGGYGGHEPLKRALLQAEGLTVGARRVRNFSRVRWIGGSTPARERPPSSRYGRQPPRRNPRLT